MPPTNTTATVIETSPAPPDVEQRKPLWDKRLTKIFWVNSVAISKDGKRVVAGTFIHDYDQTSSGKFLPNVRSRFGLYLFDDVPKVQTTDRVEPKCSDEFDGWDGVFGVAISADGKIVAASGWLDRSDDDTTVGLLRAYDADSSIGTGTVKTLLDFKEIKQRVSWVSLSDDGRVLAAVADDVYVFIRDGEAFNPIPLKLGVGEVAKRYVTGVAVHPTGDWVAACDHSGHVHVAKIKNGAIEDQVTWTAPQEYPFLSVAIASDARKFVVGGGNLVYLFDLDRLITERTSHVPPEFDTAAGDKLAGTVPPDKPDKLQENVRWVATSVDGTLITAVVNRVNSSGLAGKLFARNADLTERWQVEINNNPNSTSVDAAGRFVAMADGWPTSTPAKFYLFNASDGKKRWESDTHSMNWPIVINRDGDAIVAGSDDGTVYYFTP
jgi:WD40 repeat protein